MGFFNRGKNIGSVKELIKYLKNLETEFNLLKSDIEIIGNSNISSESKFQKYFSDFSLVSTNRSYVDNYANVKANIDNLKQEMNEILRSITSIKNVVINLYDKGLDLSKDESINVNLVSNISEIGSKWNIVRQNLGKVESLELENLGEISRLESTFKKYNSLIDYVTKSDTLIDEIKKSLVLYLKADFSEKINTDKNYLGSESSELRSHGLTNIFPQYIEFLAYLGEPNKSISEDYIKFVNESYSKLGKKNSKIEVKVSDDLFLNLFNGFDRVTNFKSKEYLKDFINNEDSYRCYKLINIELQRLGSQESDTFGGLLRIYLNRINGNIITKEIIKENIIKFLPEIIEKINIFNKLKLKFIKFNKEDELIERLFSSNSKSDNLFIFIRDFLIRELRDKKKDLEKIDNLDELLIKINSPYVPTTE